jgi:hypothetical protein
VAAERGAGGKPVDIGRAQVGYGTSRELSKEVADRDGESVAHFVLLPRLGDGCSGDLCAGFVCRWHGDVDEPFTHEGDGGAVLFDLFGHGAQKRDLPVPGEQVVSCSDRSGDVPVVDLAKGGNDFGAGACGLGQDGGDVLDQEQPATVTEVGEEASRRRLRCVRTATTPWSEWTRTPRL